MDSNEKKGKRPRIGESRSMATEGANEQNSYTSTDYNQSENQSRDFNQQGNGGGYQSRPYQQRQYQPRQYQQRPYNNRYNNHYNNHTEGGYRPRQQYQAPTDATATDSAAQGQTASEQPAEGQAPVQRQYQQRQYQPRPYNNRYNNQGYNNNRQGGYNNNRQGGYNNNRQEGGYQPRYNQGQNQGYRQQGGYNNNRQGGYNNNRQGGYNNNRQGGYNNRQGGYNNNRQGGYNKGPRQNMRQNQYGMPQGGKSFVPRPKRVEYEIPIPDPNEQIRLNKFMANAGICSRREADEYIQQGLVKVNGEVVKELGTKISHNDTVEYDGKVVTLESKCYILLNKPKDCVTTSDDPNGRLTVMDLVKNACEERIYPVGRLDRNTTGVLLLTNDGDLASKLTHPKYVKKKIYHVWTDKDISEDDMQRIADGVELEDGPIHADAISYATETDRNQAGIEIHSGRNRIVRRLFESLGYHVTKLDRVYFAGLTKKNLPRGRWRYLTQEEVNFLKMGSFE
ncbi:MAG: RNA-binding S4 domain-containing protein [Muribaculaceae bacterium]|nr:RNA-binding S4 domain-containing protein [Muribaculaceae bacterium]